MSMPYRSNFLLAFALIKRLATCICASRQRVQSRLMEFIVTPTSTSVSAPKPCIDFFFRSVLFGVQSRWCEWEGGWRGWTESAAVIEGDGDWRENWAGEPIPVVGALPVTCFGDYLYPPHAKTFTAWTLLTRFHRRECIGKVVLGRRIGSNEPCWYWARQLTFLLSLGTGVLLFFVSTTNNQIRW